MSVGQQHLKEVTNINKAPPFLSHQHLCHLYYCFMSTIILTFIPKIRNEPRRGEMTLILSLSSIITWKYFIFCLNLNKRKRAQNNPFDTAFYE